jgi:cytochrome b subunit of formate dehydrogenase
MAKLAVFVLLLLLSSLNQLSVLAQSEDDQVCLMCHGDQQLLEDEETKRLYVDWSEIQSSSHSFMGCGDCHQDVAGMGFSIHAPDLAPVDCSMCHFEAQTTYDKSLHAMARERGDKRAPGCSECHGNHNIQTLFEHGSAEHRELVLAICVTCHGVSRELAERDARIPLAAAGYLQSVHARAHERGEEGAALCCDCHDAHGYQSSFDPESPTHPLNLSATCGRCHPEIRREYDESIHGRALQAGNDDSPTCNTCHGEHLVVSLSNPDATEFARTLAIEACERCHHDERIILRYGLSDNVVSSYFDSYHGWANRLASEDAATCGSCHTTHAVQPARDPASTVHPDNVLATCQQCHPSADAVFALSYTHQAASSPHPVESWVRYIYLVLIPLLVGAMAVHNLLILNYYLQERRRRERTQGTVQRLDKSQVVQHLLLTLSFVLLVVTGFALRFPDAWWVRPLAVLGTNEATRSLIHRVAAVLLMIVAIWHIVHMLFTKKGRNDTKAMIPRWVDIRDLRETLKFHLWKRTERVQFGRFDYTQKAEYWALVWGTILMALTGLILWFPETAVGFLPGWIVPVSETIHYYEAWLATLAVVVWHGFFVILHPEVYPMSWTWLTGEMSSQMADRHHGRPESRPSQH